MEIFQGKYKNVNKYDDGDNNNDYDNHLRS